MENETSSTGLKPETPKLSEANAGDALLPDNESTFVSSAQKVGDALAGVKTADNEPVVQKQKTEELTLNQQNLKKLLILNSRKFYRIALIMAIHKEFLML